MACIHSRAALRGIRLFTVTLLLLKSAMTGWAQGIPISVDLPKSGYVTLVIEDARGNRVRNLISETLLPAGKNTILWDGYNEGRRAEGDDDVWMRDLIRQRVPPGVYTVRGLIHDRLSLRYEFSVNSPGTPPWKTKDGSGGWLADHSPAADILYLPQGTPAPNSKGIARFLVCSSSAETGEEFVWLDADGRRLYGTNTGFWGGTHLARDPGQHAIAGNVAYVFMSGERDPDNNNIEVRAFRANGDIVSVAKITFPLELKKTVLPAFKDVAEEYGTDGLAVYNGIAVFSITRQDRLVFADVRTGHMIGEAHVPAPRSLCFDGQGRLWAICGRQVRRYRPDLAQAQPGAGETVVAQGLEAPRGIALDAAGAIYVSDGGRSHQVKVFTPQGHCVRVIGRSGGPQLGRYDEQRMSYPSGMAVDGQGRLWVAEAENAPRRLSLWDAKSGTFVHAIYGPSQYGGGGKLDPADPTRLYMDPAWSTAGVTWSLDWKAGIAKPAAVYWRKDSPNVDAMPDTVPETILRRDGYRYLVDCYNDKLRYNQDRGVGIWRLDRDEIARPVAIIGNAADLVNGIWGIPLRHRDAITTLWKNLDPTTVMFVWCDRNGDGIAEPDEIRFRQVPSPRDGRPLHDVGLGAQVLPDLSFVTTWGIHIAPPQIDGHGVPQYDLNRLDFVGNTARYSERVAAGGWTLYTRIGVEGLSGSRVDGAHLWSYQTAEGGQPVPGLLTEPTRLMGLPITPRQGEAGPLFAHNSDKGGIYLLTMDGLFLQTLGGDARCTPQWRIPAAEARRGMNVDQFTYGEEQFHPTVVQAEKDGKIYFVIGHEHSSIARLDGMETVKRLSPFLVTVGSTSLASLPETRVERARKTGRNTLTVHRLAAPPALNSKPGSWVGADWVTLDDRASAAVGVSGDTLYAAWRTGDPNALVGGPGDFRYQFKHGGALDLMLGLAEKADPRRSEPAAGDIRLLVTQINGKTRAVLYCAVAPDAPAAQAVLFSSPIGQAHFDQVLDVTDRVMLKAGGRGDFEIAVPLSTLGLALPQSGQELLGDIGLLRGDGAQTTQRLYWNNQETGMVSDVPTEARLRPANWGLWRFE
jgi:sugar lactone lactonase YvrE